MPGTPPPASGDLFPQPSTRPLWRRGSWPLWIAVVLSLLLIVRDLPALFQALTGDPTSASGPMTLLGLSLLLAVALGVAALAPGRLTAAHLGLTPPRLVDVVMWSALSLGALYGVVWLGSVMSGTPHQDTNFGMGNDMVSDLMLVVGLGTVGPVAEEFAYRGTLFRGISDGLSSMVKPKVAAGAAVVLSSAVFMLAHTGAPVWHQLAYFAFAVVLAVGYWWTGSLYVALVPHLLNNAYVAVTIAKDAHAHTAVIIVAALSGLLGLGLAYGIGRLLPQPR